MYIQACVVRVFVCESNCKSVNHITHDTICRLCRIATTISGGGREDDINDIKYKYNVVGSSYFRLENVYVLMHVCLGMHVVV